MISLLIDTVELGGWLQEGRNKQYLMQGIDFPGGLDGKASAYNVGDLGSIPGKIPWRRQWPPTPIFLPGEACGQRSLAAVHGVAQSRTWLSC